MTTLRNAPADVDTGVINAHHETLKSLKKDVTLHGSDVHPMMQPPMAPKPPEIKPKGFERLLCGCDKLSQLAIRVPEMDAQYGNSSSMLDFYLSLVRILCST